MAVHQTNLPISLHRNSESCALSRNSRLKFLSADILKESYPARQVNGIAELSAIDSTLSSVDQFALPVQKANLYRQFLEVASSDHRLDFSLSLHCFMPGGLNWRRFCVLQTFSGSLVESLIVSVSNYDQPYVIHFLTYLIAGYWANS